MAMVESAFGKTTLAEILAEPTSQPAAVRGGGAGAVASADVAF